MTERLTEIKYNGIVSKKREETGISCSQYCTSCSQGGGNCEYVCEMIKKLEEYETAEEEGRLVVFPCKVGDILFVITPDSPIGIETTKCIRLSIDKRGIKIQAPAVHDDWGNAKWNFKPIDFGKKVFLDFEEAKKALREREENQSE